MEAVGLGGLHSDNSVTGNHRVRVPSFQQMSPCSALCQAPCGGRYEGRQTVTTQRISPASEDRNVLRCTKMRALLTNTTNEKTMPRD